MLPPTPESVVLHDVRLALGRAKDLVLWRLSQGAIGDWIVERLSSAARGCLDDPDRWIAELLAVWRSARVHVRFGLGAGMPDTIGIGPAGRFVGFEIKSLRGKITPAQVMALNLIAARGGFSRVLRSTADAMQALEDLRHGRG